MEHCRRSLLSVVPSPIQGFGVFAIESIRSGTVLLRIDDSRVIDRDHPLKTEAGESAIHLDYLPDKTTVLMQLPERYINHSCEPNCYIYSVNRERFLLARRDVTANEEILIDYAINAIDGDEWQCRCGAPNCRGYHKCDFFTLSLADRRKYLPYLDAWFAGVHALRIRGLLSDLSEGRIVRP